jgi:hypothetical protein
VGSCKAAIGSMSRRQYCILYFAKRVLVLTTKSAMHIYSHASPHASFSRHLKVTYPPLDTIKGEGKIML